MQNFRSITRHGYCGIEVDGSLLFYSPRSKRLAAFPIHKNITLTRRKLDDALAKTEPEVANLQPKKRQIGFINTTDCLLRCIYCFNNGGESRNYLQPDLAGGIIEAFLKEGECERLVVKFFGGEPTLNMPLIRHVVAVLAQYDIDVGYHVVSAGYIAHKDFEWMIEKNFIFTLSIDGQEAIQREQRPFQGNPEGLLTPEQCARRLSVAGTEFKVRMTVTANNVWLLPETIRYFAELGTRIVHVEPVTFAGRGKDGIHRPDAEQFTEMLIQAIDEAARLDVQVINSSYMNLLQHEQAYCSAGNDHIVVGVNAEISRCYELADPCAPHAEEMIWGRYDHETGRIVYNGDTAAADCGTCTHLISPACINCFSASVCGGGCPSRNLADAGDIHNQGGYFCQITRRLFPAVMVRIAREAGLI